MRTARKAPCSSRSSPERMLALRRTWKLLKRAGTPVL